MVIAVVALATVVLLGVCASLSDGDRLDPREIRTIRKVADRLRKEECQPFD